MFIVYRWIHIKLQRSYLGYMMMPAGAVEDLMQNAN